MNWEKEIIKIIRADEYDHEDVGHNDTTLKICNFIREHFSLDDDSRPVEKLVRRKARLRLFVWTGFSPDYTSGLAFAIAKDETEAKKLIEKTHGYSPSTWGDLEVLPLTKKTAFSVSGGG